MKALILIPILLLIPLSSFAYNYPPVPISNAILKQTWHDRTDLQTAYPEVSTGNYTRIYTWATTEPSNANDRSGAELTASNEIKISNSPIVNLATPKVIGIGFELLWNSTTNGQYHCSSYGPFYNVTINKIEGSEYMAIIYSKNLNQSFSESLSRLMISPFYVTDGTDGKCHDQKNNVMNWFSWRDNYTNNDMSFIFPAHITKLQYPNMADSQVIDWNVNATIPNGYYINLITDDLSQITSGYLDKEYNLRAYVK